MASSVLISTCSSFAVSVSGISVTSVTVSPARASTFSCMSISCSETTSRHTRKCRGSTWGNSNRSYWHSRNRYCKGGISVTSVNVSPARASTISCMSISCSERIHSVQ